MRRYLFILSWHDRRVFEMVEPRLTGTEGVEVVRDRRFRERRRRDAPVTAERRSFERRRYDIERTLDLLGWAVLRNDAAFTTPAR